MQFLIKPVSSECNMNCSYCFYRDEANSRKTASYGMMTTELSHKIIDRAFETGENEYAFMFQGGEPTLAGIDFFRDFVEYVKMKSSKNLSVSYAIQTNGLCLDEEWAEFFAKNKFLVGISIDGTAEIHNANRKDCDGGDTYAKVLKNANMLMRHKVEINALCVVTSVVARHAGTVYNSLRKAGFKFLQFIPCLDPFEGKKEKYSLTCERYGQFLKTLFDFYYNSKQNVSIETFEDYLRILLGAQPLSCGRNGICGEYLLIEADGSAFPCDFYAIDKYLLGNIKDKDIISLIDEEKDFLNESDIMNKECYECEYVLLCRGGCRREREPFSCGLPSLNKFCGAYKEFFEYALPRLEDMADLIKDEL